MISSYFILADIEGFLGIVFFLIAFVGWVINLVNQNQENGTQTKKRPSNSGRKQNVQKEIDQFLGQAKRKSIGSSSIETDDVELISPPPTRRAPPRRRRSREEILAEQSGRSIPNPQPVKPPKKKSNSGIASRHLESQGKQKSQKSIQLSHMSEQVQKDLPHAVDAHVSSHLHSFTAENPGATGQIGMTSTTANRKTKASLLGQLLKSKNDIRNAIIMSEILSPPRSLRK